MIPLKKPDKKMQRPKPVGRVRYRPPNGDGSDSPLERIHQDYEATRKGRSGRGRQRD